MAHCSVFVKVESLIRLDTLAPEDRKLKSTIVLCRRAVLSGKKLESEGAFMSIK